MPLRQPCGRFAGGSGALAVVMANSPAKTSRRVISIMWVANWQIWHESPPWCSLVQIGRQDSFQLMRDLLLLAIHLLVPSRPGEFHPEPLTDPDLTLSRHPARAIA
jgi:hypothetical protein